MSVTPNYPSSSSQMPLPPIEEKKTIPTRPPRFPNPVEAGGSGNCAIFSLLHQTSQIQGKEWSKISRKELNGQVNDLRNLSSHYMQTHRHQLAQDEDFWNDLVSGWNTVFKEQFKELVKSLNPEKLRAFAQTLGPNTSLEEAKMILLATADNWKCNLPQDPNQAQEVKSQIIEIFSEYMGKPNVQLDACFWNVYTKMANDREYMDTQGKSFPIKQIVLIMKIGEAYQTVGLWPKENGEENRDFSECGYIYYNGSTHYQSFDRNQIIDYMTLEPQHRPHKSNGCTIS